MTVNIGGLEHHDDASDLPNPDDPDADESNQDGDPEDENPQETLTMTREELTEAVTAAVAPALASLSSRLDSIESNLEDVSDPQDTATQDAVARAEILRPGFKLPTFDAKPGSKTQRDSIVSMKKAVLRDAFYDKEAHRHVAPFVSSPRPDFEKMSAGEVDILFRAASQSARDSNVAQFSETARKAAGYTVDESGKKKVVDARTINEINKKFYANRR